MNAWQIFLIIIVPILALICAIILLLYYVAMPKKLVKMIRGGKENLKMPDDFDAIANKVTIQRDLTYKSPYPNATFDLYSPKNHQNKGLVVWVHGGFFIAGDKVGVENVCTAISANGYNVAAINYVTAPEHKYPTALVQLDNFVEYSLTELPNLAENGVIIAGDSAGGQIAAQYSLLINSQKLQTDMNFKPYLAAPMLRAIALVCAPIDIAHLRGRHKVIDFLLPTFGRVFFGNGKWYKSPKYNHTHLFDYIEDNFPPCFITDGNRVSFEEQNKKLASLLRSKGCAVTDVFFDKNEFGEVNHEYLFDMTLGTSPIAMAQLLNFLDNTSN